MDGQQFLSSLPSVDEILKSMKGMEWLRAYPRRLVLPAIRKAIEASRRAILQGDIKELFIDDILAAAETEMRGFYSFSLQPVINATGIVIHTNLGRSPLPYDVLENVIKNAQGYSNLEYNLDKGKRGKRHAHVRRLLTGITGAEDGLIVNNNAAAVFVCLAALAKGKEVIVSRGELVEIGGSFRVPDVMSSSGAILREVGTTNKTHPQDYLDAINDNTGLILKVHQSNYRMMGFTESVEIEDLVSIGEKHDIPVMFDLGSGCLVDLKPYGVLTEPTVQEIVKTMCDIVTFSGDKLLGGPQGGIIVGRSKVIDIIAKNPMMRAVRIDKLTLAALEATLMKYLDDEQAKKEIPTLRMLLQDLEVIRKRAETIASRLNAGTINAAGATAGIEVREDSSRSGGGALPEVEFRTFAVAIKPVNISINQLETRLRHSCPPIIARIKDDTLFLDARTVQDNEIDALVKNVVSAMV